MELGTLIIPRAHDIGGFEVRRALPSAQRQMVGPFIFFDQMGPGEFLTGQGLDVRPHPHIGLSIVTYLFAGQILHLDSLSVRQAIDPGDVNWMTAGRGIVHSDGRTRRCETGPTRFSESKASWRCPRRGGARARFRTPRSQQPAGHRGWRRPVAADCRHRLGQTAPVRPLWPLFYSDATLAPAAAMPLESGHEERAAYIVQGGLAVAGELFEAGRMLVFRAGDGITLTTGAKEARLLLLGGAVLDGPYIYWNFVGSSRESCLRC